MRPPRPHHAAPSEARGRLRGNPRTPSAVIWYGAVLHLRAPRGTGGRVGPDQRLLPEQKETSRLFSNSKVNLERR